MTLSIPFPFSVAAGWTKRRPRFWG